MFSIFVLSACNPDKLKIEVYTSDFTSAAEEKVVEVPLKASFSIMGGAESIYHEIPPQFLIK